jgi:hypothetical protein
MSLSRGTEVKNNLRIERRVVPIWNLKARWATCEVVWCRCQSLVDLWDLNSYRVKELNKTFFTLLRHSSKLFSCLLLLTTLLLKRFLEIVKLVIEFHRDFICFWNNRNTLVELFFLAHKLTHLCLEFFFYFVTAFDVKLRFFFIRGLPRNLNA